MLGRLVPDPLSDASGRTPTFTVFTPAHNSADVLPRAYESLRIQTFRDFEWVVIDDGSTDRTRELVLGWTSEAPFPIHYFYQSNAGKPAASNRANEVARGLFIANLDHDDWYAPTTLERFLAVWRTIPLEIRDEFVGVVGLSAYSDGKVIGTMFPKDPLDSDYWELVERYHITGDKVGFGRLEVVREFPYPRPDNERYCTEALILNRIANEYKVRCVNEILQFKEYQEGSMTRWGIALFAKNPISTTLYYRELLPRAATFSFKRRYKVHANHIRFALHARHGVESFRHDPSKLLWAASAPVGLALYVRDRLQLARHTEAVVS